MGHAWRAVIVNYRTPQLAQAASRSVRAASPAASIVVVDNASGDNSRELIHQDGVAEYLAMPQNLGYGAALNAGTRSSDAAYFLLMNADVRMAPDGIRRFEKRFESLPRLGIVAPRLLSADGSVQPSCRRFPTHRSLLFSRGSPLQWLRAPTDRSYRLPEPATFTLTDVIAGACWAVRREAWQELQGMDERFFLYAEDTDFCRRAKRQGWLVGYDPAVAVTHLWGASTSQARRRSQRQHAESLALYFRKHFPERKWANVLVSGLLRGHARLRF
jgi:GT2 family glycosyltransferase